MIATTEAYKENIKADTEQIRFKGELVLVPPGITDGMTVTTYTLADVSAPAQLYNGIFGMGGNWGTLEENRIRLDGTVSFIPDDKSAQIGVFSSRLALAATGNVSPVFWVQYQFAADVDLAGVSICFDDLGGEYAKYLSIIYYNAAGTVLKRQSISKNDSPTIYVEMKQTGVRRLRVQINRWNVPQHRVKIAQIQPGLVLSLDAEGVYGFDHTEAISPFSGTLTMPENKVTFDNTDGEFNILNPNGLIQFLRQKMHLAPQLQLLKDGRVDSINMGNYYLYDFPRQANPDDMTISARPSVAFGAAKYNSGVTSKITVAKACEYIFAGVDGTYSVDADLASITVNGYIGDDVPISTAMAYLAIAVCGYWQIGRDNSYTLHKWATPTTMLDVVTYDNAWERPAAEMAEKYTSCTCRYWTYDSSSKALKSTDITVTAGDNDGAELSITSYFVADAARAKAVATAALAYSNQSLVVTVQYRGDMAYEAGDAIGVQTDFGVLPAVVLQSSISMDDSGCITGTLKLKAVGDVIPDA